MKTISDMKSKKKMLEEAFLEMICDFEKEFEVVIDDIDLTHAEKLGGDRNCIGIEIKVTF